jgi:hypothetical protein
MNKFKKIDDNKFTGGVKSAKLSEQSVFRVSEVDGKYQIDYKGTKEDYRELAKMFSALAEIDLSEDENNVYHHHMDDLQEDNVECIFSRVD